MTLVGQRIYQCCLNQRVYLFKRQWKRGKIYRFAKTRWAFVSDRYERHYFMKDYDILYDIIYIELDNKIKKFFEKMFSVYEVPLYENSISFDFLQHVLREPGLNFQRCWDFYKKEIHKDLIKEIHNFGFVEENEIIVYKKT